jgi:hypothetical protein
VAYVIFLEIPFRKAAFAPQNPKFVGMKNASFSITKIALSIGFVALAAIGLSQDIS